MLEVKALSCIRDERILFEKLNFTVSSGDLIQIEGPNGAGKTSLLRIILGLGIPDSGLVCWQGVPIHDDRESYYQDLLYIGHHAGIKRELTAFENLMFYQQMHGQLNEEKVWYALARAGLTGYEDIPAAQLSAGQHRRIALARLWISQAKLWVLDEPLTAIDKQGIKVLESTLMQHVEKGGMVIFTTHQDMFLDQPLLQRIKLGG